MTSRHATAVMLLGWYLMIPPLKTSFFQTWPAISRRSKGESFLTRLVFAWTASCNEDESIWEYVCGFDKDALLGTWEQFNQFESLEECERNQSIHMNNAWEDVRTSSPSSWLGKVTERNRRRWNESKCIATDDPRLAK